MNELEAERVWAEKQSLSELRDEFAKAAITGILRVSGGSCHSTNPKKPLLTLPIVSLMK